MGKYDFKFGDYWISELGAVSTEVPGVEIAQRDFELIQIPGKDGDDCIDNGRYENVEFSRSISFIGRQHFPAKDKAANFIDTFAYLQGYQTFEDTDHDELVTEAVLTNFGEINKKLRSLHAATLKFTRKPFWYLKESLIGQSMDLTATTPSLTLNNPFMIGSKPKLIFVFAANQTNVDFTYKVTTGGTSTSYRHHGSVSPHYYQRYIVDCEEEIVRGETSYGNFVSNDDMPKGFSTGQTTVEITAGKSYLSSVLIAPQWRCL